MSHREHIDSREGRYAEADAYAGYQEYLDSQESSEGWFYDLDRDHDEPDPSGGYEPGLDDMPDYDEPEADFCDLYPCDMDYGD